MRFPSFLREYHILKNGFTVAGFDEVGRGCIAGPVVAGAVMLYTTEELPVAGVRDSKKLSEARRNILSQCINSTHKYTSIGLATNSEIDSLGIVNATKLAMLRAYWGFPIQPDILLIDGKKTTQTLTSSTYQYVKGDDKAYSIAAASIIAKVYRDNLMSNLQGDYKVYEFGSHKGYGTKAHYESLKEYGVSDIHRRTFLRNFTL